VAHHEEQIEVANASVTVLKGGSGPATLVLHGFEGRAIIDVKGKGAIETYLLVGRRARRPAAGSAHRTSRAGH